MDDIAKEATPNSTVNTATTKDQQSKHIVEEAQYRLISISTIAEMIEQL